MIYKECGLITLAAFLESHFPDSCCTSFSVTLSSSFFATLPLNVPRKNLVSGQVWRSASVSNQGETDHGRMRFIRNIKLRRWFLCRERKGSTQENYGWLQLGKAFWRKTIKYILFKNGLWLPRHRYKFKRRKNGNTKGVRVCQGTGFLLRNKPLDMPKHMWRKNNFNISFHS